MKLLISNQHGAIIMALMPFLYGMLLSQPSWLHLFLLLAWCCLYLMSYPFLNLFKGRNLALYKKWTLIYGVCAALFALPVLWHNPHMLAFLVAMLPFITTHIYYIKQKNERALLNDFAGIIIFAIAGMASYYLTKNSFDAAIWQVALYPTIFFIGTTLYVKSVMRERKNQRYLKASIIFHCGCVSLCLFSQQYWLALAFMIPCGRAYVLPKKSLSIKQIGLIEIAVSVIFFIFLLYATL